MHFGLGIFEIRCNFKISVIVHKHDGFFLYSSEINTLKTRQI